MKLIVTYFITCLSLGLAFLSCRNDKKFVGHWKPLEVKQWNNYHNDSVVVNLTTRQFYFAPNNYETAAILTPGVKDSLLRLLSMTHLTLESNGTFLMEDYAFLTQNLLDTAWHNVKAGKWSIDMNDSLLTLSHPNGLKKCYKVLSVESGKLNIGELFECEGRPITEIVLSR